jgi:hypothetical protein
MTTLVTIDRWNVWRVVDMPGLTRIDLDGHRATLVFATSPGCEPVDPEFIANEVMASGPVGIRVLDLGVRHKEKDDHA